MATHANNHRIIHGVHFLKLKGTYAERARQHGEILKKEIHNGPLQALAKKNQWIIKRAGGALDFPPLQKMALKLYDHWLLPKLEKALPKRELDILHQLSEASGLPYDIVLKAMFQADGLMLLSRFSVMKYLFKDFPAQELPGCSSSVVHPSWTAKGKMLVSRNQDYPVVGPWEANTTVIFHEPTEANEIPHISVASAGLHTSGLTSMNAEGITVAAHAHFGKDVSLKGLPIFVVGGEIAAKAKSLSEAIDLANKMPRNANWTLVISSAKEKNAMAMEMTPTKVVPRYMEDGLLSHTNFFHTDLRQNEALICGGRHHDDQARICRMKQVLTQNKGSIVPETMAKMLGDHTDPWTGEERVLGNTISVMSTVKSVVFSPDEQIFHVSSRGRSPMGLGDFLTVDVRNFWQDTTHENAWPVIEGNRPKNPNLILAIDIYRKGYCQWHMHNSQADYAEKALEHIKAASDTLPTDPHLALQTAHVAFKLGQFDLAHDYLLKSKDGKMASYLEVVRDLFLARCLDLQNKREEALHIYRQWAGHSDKRVGAAFKQGMKRPFHPKKTQALMLDMQFVDPIIYG